VEAVASVAPGRKHSTYNGALANPIGLRPPPTFSGGVSPKRVADYQKRLSRHERANAAMVQRQHAKKLAMLFDHYGIADRENWTALALALAAEHVPGFKVQLPKAKSKRRKKRKWTPERLGELYRTVQSIKEQHHFTDRQALKFMAKNERHAATWGVPAGHRGSEQQWIETLEARYQEAKQAEKLSEKMQEQLDRELRAIQASMKFRK
jgi:hypothetical protein